MINVPTLAARCLRARVFVGIAVGGGCNALILKYSDPGALSFTKAGITKFAAVFAAGAIIALIHLFQTLPAISTAAKVNSQNDSAAGRS